MKAERTWRRWCLWWTLFIGIGAVVGALMMWLGPDVFGMAPLLELMQVLPFADVLFQSFLWPGVFLLVINGLTQLIAAILILTKHRYAWIAVLVCGGLLLGWIALQFIIFTVNPLSSIYLVFALAEITMALLWRRAIRYAGSSD